MTGTIEKTRNEKNEEISQQPHTRDDVDYALVTAQLARSLPSVCHVRSCEFASESAAEMRGLTDARRPALRI